MGFEQTAEILNVLSKQDPQEIHYSLLTRLINVVKVSTS
jgi:hypothetical protein